MGKGHVIFEKAGKTYVINDKRFLFLSKKGFSKVVCVPAGHVIHIYINDEDISNIQFIDCDFDVFDFGFMSVFIHIQSKNTQVYMDNVSYNKHQELFIESQNIIVAKNINNSGLLGLRSESVSVNSLKNTGLQIHSLDVSITDYYSEYNNAFTILAQQNLELNNISVINTKRKIEIESPIINYFNISLISNRINLPNILSTYDISTVNDTILEHIQKETQSDRNKLNRLNVPNNLVTSDIKKPLEKSKY